MDRSNSVTFGVTGTASPSPYLLLPLRTLDQARVAAVDRSQRHNRLENRFANALPQRAGIDRSDAES